MADPTNIGDFATYAEAFAVAAQHQGQICACTVDGKEGFACVMAPAPGPRNFTAEIGSIEGVRFLDAPRRGGQANG